MWEGPLFAQLQWIDLIGFSHSRQVMAVDSLFRDETFGWPQVFFLFWLCGPAIIKFAWGSRQLLGDQKLGGGRVGRQSSWHFKQETQPSECKGDKSHLYTDSSLWGNWGKAGQGLEQGKEFWSMYLWDHPLHLLLLPCHWWPLLIRNSEDERWSLNLRLESCGFHGGWFIKFNNYF